MKRKFTTKLRIVYRWLAAAALAGSLYGCAGTPPRNPLPLELTKQAVIPGIPEARFWGNEWPRFSMERIETFSDVDFKRHFPAIYKTEHNYLAISGGGANGAFGAGLLVGWTEAGTRPEFSMVTGVSTGALSAPFAFLGPDYDDELMAVYTTTATEQVARMRNIVAAAFSDSIVDTAPLREMIKRYIDTDIIEAIAREHARGRRLYIGTVNLDASRAVIWSIGDIAASNYARKEELIRDVLLASASIPVAFPPVMVSVEADGRIFDEMHVDGGTGSQVFVYPAAINWKEITRQFKVRGTPRVYIIRNSFLNPDYRGVKRGIIPIGIRTIDSLIRTQGIGDLYQIYALSTRDGNKFNLAYIPASFTEEPTESFDPDYMKKLFNLGHKMALDGYPWKKKPPGFRADMGDGG